MEPNFERMALDMVFPSVEAREIKTLAEAFQNIFNHGQQTALSNANVFDCAQCKETFSKRNQEEGEDGADICNLCSDGQFDPTAFMKDHDLFECVDCGEIFNQANGRGIEDSIACFRCREESVSRVIKKMNECMAIKENCDDESCSFCHGPRYGAEVGTECISVAKLQANKDAKYPNWSGSAADRESLEKKD